MIFKRVNMSAALIFAVALFFSVANSQTVVDRTIATVSDGARSELITYSDLLWQLALQPGIPIEPPRSEDLNRALQSLIDQRLFTLEAERLPRLAPTEREIADEVGRLLRFFPSTAAFEQRLKQVGFDSIRDPAFEQLIARRLATQKYTDFRFRAFAVVSADEIARYYRDVFVPDFRRRYPGLLVPTIEDRRDEITSTLTETKVAERIDVFLEDAKRRVRIEILFEV